MKRVFVDTGAWYALVDRKDPDHGRVVPVFRAYQRRLLSSNFVIDETLTLIRYRLSWDAAHAFGEKVRAGGLVEVIRVDPACEDAAWAIFSRYRDKTFSFTDCTSFALMDRLRPEAALAIDQDFRAYGLRCLP